jgi:hypothetical protein
VRDFATGWRNEAVKNERRNILLTLTQVVYDVINVATDDLPRAAQVIKRFEPKNSRSLPLLGSPEGNQNHL